MSVYICIIKTLCRYNAGGSFPYTLGRIARGYEVRPDLCAVGCSRSPRSFAGDFYVDSLVHDTTALQLLVDVIGQVGAYALQPQPLTSLILRYRVT